MGKYQEVNLRKINVKFHTRYKVSVEHESKIFSDDLNFNLPFPNTGKAKEFVEFVNLIINAKDSSKPIVVMCGGHVIKTGCSPILIELMKRGFITHLASNGAFAIHDVELSISGHTSEFVEELLPEGSFGFNKRVCDFLNDASKIAKKHEIGYGEAMGKMLLDMSPAYVNRSVVAWAYKLNVPYTVHVALGTDINHQFPSADGGAIGDASLRDFRILINTLKDLSNGGIVMNLGSCVIMPEVFLKAINVARNIFGNIDGFVTANFDMINHYRPMENVVKRPTFNRGRGFCFIGHHEILLPLFFAMILKMQKPKPKRRKNGVVTNQKSDFKRNR